MRGTEKLLVGPTDAVRHMSRAHGNAATPSSPAARTAPNARSAARVRCAPAVAGALLGAADVVFIGLIGLLALWLQDGSGASATASPVIAALCMGVLAALSLSRRGMYSHAALLSRGIALRELALAVATACSVLILVGVAVTLLAHDNGAPRQLDWPAAVCLAAKIAALALASLAALIGLRALWLRLGPHVVMPQRVIVVGEEGTDGDLLARVRRPSNRDSVAILADGSGESDIADVSAAPDSVEAVLNMVRREQVDSVVIALSGVERQRIRGLTASLATAPVDVYVAADLAGEVADAAPREVALLLASTGPLSPAKAVLKRTEDLVLAGLLALLAVPLMLVVAVLVKATSRGPVFFRQRRVGLNNQVFGLLKFRTMYAHCADSDARRQTSRNDARVTKLGSFLRRSSLDELPQLWNVLRGEMSLVGPRPHALQTTVNGVQLEAAAPGYSSRHRVKPGITGWAQVNGCRGELDTVEKIVRRVDYDLDYIRNWSLLLDLQIIWRTLRIVIADPNAY
jgi:Undecaprenyl-phosphate glucose phosphotransferase